MSQLIIDRIQRKLAAAEGFLTLNLPLRALEILKSRDDWATMRFEASFLEGESLRLLGRHREALKPLEDAASLRPADPNVAIALGWCYKRTARLAQAIDGLVRALRQHPELALLHYNLACYWTLANNHPEALRSLASALKADPEVRGLISGESDFDGLRSDPEFQRLVGPADLEAELG